MRPALFFAASIAAGIIGGCWYFVLDGPAVDRALSRMKPTGRAFVVYEVVVVLVSIPLFLAPLTMVPALSFWFATRFPVGSGPLELLGPIVGLIAIPATIRILKGRKGARNLQL
jgi:hypothetical protein